LIGQLLQAFHLIFGQRKPRGAKGQDYDFATQTFRGYCRPIDGPQGKVRRLGYYEGGGNQKH
jgi:hypothetical protein